MQLSLAEFAGLLAVKAIELEHVTHSLLEEAGHLVETEAKRVIGTYEYGWPQLAQATQDDRSRKGFSPNDPLLRTGELRDSIEHHVAESGLWGGSVHIGSNNPKARWQELGTSRTPPRSFLGLAAAHEGANISERVGRAYQAVLIGGAFPDRIK